MYGSKNAAYMNTFAPSKLILTHCVILSKFEQFTLHEYLASQKCCRVEKQNPLHTSKDLVCINIRGFTKFGIKVL